ncbi:MAG TPA: class I SAM-dependent methyltransferase [Gaiellaceae bacterium]
MNRTVQAGYDELAPRFGEWMRNVEGDPWERFLEELASRLPEGAHVLDLGCGNGDKLARLAEKFEVTGVDLSAEQLQLAGARVPEARLIHADFSELELAEESFDAVTAFYSIIHVPREAHAELFERILRWLKPGGLFLASLSHVGSPDRTEEWLGVQMFFSSFPAETNRRLVLEAGFELLIDEVVVMTEPEDVESGWIWVLGRKPE